MRVSQLIISILALGVFVGCMPVNNSEGAAGLITPTLINASDTLSPQPTLQASPSEIPEDAILPSPLPTLNSNESLDLVEKMFTDNNACELPCWWGIVPGETTWEDAERFLSTFSTSIRQGNSRSIIENDNTFLVTNYSVYYPVKDSIEEGRTVYGLRDNIVSLISVDPVGTEISYTLEKILLRFGTPDDVVIQTFPSSPIGFLPFRIILYYGEIGFLSYFEYRAQRDDNILEWCYSAAPPELWLWSPSRELSMEELAPDVIGTEPDKPPRSITDVTNVDLASFTEMFSSPTELTCLQTPSDIWP